MADREKRQRLVGGKVSHCGSARAGAASPKTLISKG
jgi:hypothetical protein